MRPKINVIERNELSIVLLAKILVNIQKEPKK